MKNLLTICVVLLFNLVHAQSDLRLWYRQPARNWNEALPLGNGRLGVMVFGRVEDELLQLNEETLWSGGPANLNPNPQAPQLLEPIRAALFKGDYETAEKLTQRLQGPFTESYEPLGDVHIRQQFAGEGSVEEYYRDLDIATATSLTRFSKNGIRFTREVFVSAPQQVIVVRLTASQKNALNFSVSTSSPLYHAVRQEGKELLLEGKAPSHTDPSYMQTMQIPVVYNDPQQCRGMRFQLRISATTADGEVNVDGTSVTVKNASECLLILSAATSFNGFDKCPDKEGRDEKALAAGHMTKAAALSYSDLRAGHVADYKKFFDRVSINLGANAPELPTDERLRLYATGARDNHLEALYFQFGRYLLISSSRPGGIPANLQGIWNNHVRPPWSSNFTTNINAEMNYWMAESCNLSELHSPLFELIKQLSANGAATARNFYNASGWTLHHNTDIWATSGPMSGNPQWANWPMGAAWLSQHLWEHYMFTGDEKFLKEVAYPLMKGAAQFCIDWLVEDPDGRLVTAPSTSPENEYINDAGFKGTVAIASTMDMSLIWDLFTNLIDASSHLKTDPAYREMLLAKRDKLFPLQIGKRGHLQEWQKDWADADPQHRHVSHLFGIFPGRQISPIYTPVLADAVRKSMEFRGDGGTGWSKGWKINIWARLHDGDHAYKLIREQLKVTGSDGTNYSNAGGTYPNLLDAHPPFQIDGNFGGTSGMTEMLLQSHDAALHILPALPTAWKDGFVKGLKARGGFTVDITWKAGRVSEIRLHSALGGNARLRTTATLSAKGLRKAAGRNTNMFQQETNADGTVSPPGFNLYDLATEPGKVYIIKGR